VTLERGRRRMKRKVCEKRGRRRRRRSHVIGSECPTTSHTSLF